MINNMSASVEQLQADLNTALRCLEEAEHYKQQTHLAVQALEDENEELVDEIQDMLDEEQEMQTRIQTMALESARLKLQNKCLQEDRDALTDRLLRDETNLNTKYSQPELELKIEQARTEERSKIFSIMGEQQRAHDTTQMEKDQMQVELERLMHVHPQPSHIHHVSAANTFFTSCTTSSRRGSHSTAGTTPSDGNSQAAGATFSWLNHAMDHLLARDLSSRSTTTPTGQDNAEEPGGMMPETKTTLPNMQHHVSLSPKEPASDRGAGCHRHLRSMIHTTTNITNATCSFEKKKKRSSSFLKEGALECDFVGPGDRRSSSLDTFPFKHIEFFVDHDKPNTLVRKVQDQNLYSTFGQVSTSSIQFEDDDDGSTFVSNIRLEWPFELTRETPKTEETPMVSSFQSPKLHRQLDELDSEGDC
jgi:hypothetical protein